MPSQIDCHFARYRETGEPDALAAVFDETAPGLLLLAIHLTKDEVVAEDLVQLTFLKVIEHAGSYDPDRAFLPWASTILSNEARQQWRRETRGPTVVGEEVDEYPDTTPIDPQQAASEAETIHAIVNAIDGLEATYRPVVRLKVVHGMKPGAIAKVLDLDPGVTRTRLSRGLSQLRSRLPETVAGALAITLGGRGLAQVRQAVMDRVAVDGGHGAEVGDRARRKQSVSSGMRRGTAGRLGRLSVALSVLAACAVWWAFADSGHVPPPGTPKVVSLDGGATNDGGAAPVHVRRAADEASDGAAGEAEAASWTLSGVVYSDGRPLAGARVAVSLVMGCDERSVPVVSTGVAGRYEVSLDGLKRLGELGLLDASLALHVTAPDHQPALEVVLDVGPPTWRESWRLQQDLALMRGPVLRARVLGPDHEPMTGRVLGRLLSSDTGVRSNWIEVGRGARAGERLDSAELLLPVVGAPPYRLEVTGGEGSAFVELPYLPAGGHVGDVVLDPMARIRGRVVTGEGVPVPFANVHVRRVDPASGGAVGIDAATRPAWRDGRVVGAEARDVRTDALGEFEAHSLRAGTYRVSLDYGHVPQVERLGRTDDPPLDLVVEGQVLSVWAVDRDGNPVPGMTLLYECNAQGGRRSGRNAINDVPGRFDFLVPYGSSWTFRSGHWRARAEQLEHHVAPGVPRVELRMPVEPPTRSGRIELTVVGEDGSSVDDYGVELHHRESDHYVDTIDGRSLHAMRLPPGGYTMTVTPLLPVPNPASAFDPVARDVTVVDGDVATVAVTVARRGVLDVVVGRGDVPAGGRIRVERLVGDRWCSAGVLLPREGVAGSRDADISLRAALVFRAGGHTLRFVGIRGVSAPCSVDIGSGRITEVRASFGPR